MNRLDIFLDRSSAVGNENILIEASGLETALADTASGTRFVRSTFTTISEEPLAGSGGIDHAVMDAQSAVAATGTVVIDSADEAIRRASCLAETLVAIVPASVIVDTIADTAPILEKSAESDASFVAFITGASRTADIERVLTIGVHGPKRMRVIVITDR